MLYQHPEIARHVQELVVRQEGSHEVSKNMESSAVRRSFYAGPSCVCVAVKRVATKLDALQSFVWGGEDYPWDDDIWLVLRQSCVPFPPFLRTR